MELDTGAAVSLLLYRLYKEKFSHLSLGKTPVRLKTYSGEHVLSRGLIMIKEEVKEGEKSMKLPLLVVNGTTAGMKMVGENYH